MKKIISLLIISSLFNSCETSNKPITNCSQDLRDEISNEDKEEFQRIHTVLEEPYISEKNKENIDIERLRNIIWKDLKNFKSFKVYMQTSKFNVWVDQMEDGSYRYASWSKSKTIDQKPDLILKNGEVTFGGSARNHWYTFKNVDTEYICDINVLGKTNDDAFLIVKQGRKNFIEPTCRIFISIYKFIPKK